MKISIVQVTRRRRRPLHAALALLTFLSSCSTVDSVGSSLFGNSGPQSGQPGYVSGFLGGVAADEPRAALAGREVLSEGGSAGDAAVAMGLTLAVTLPSRAGLGGGGACLAYVPDEKAKPKGRPEAVLFLPPAPASGGGGDRPAAVPMLARGLFLLHARYGRLPFETLLSSAEQLARFGVPVSRALAQDLSVVAGPLFGDPAARATFSMNGVPLTEGQTLREPDLAATLAQLRVAGVGDMYLGGLARRIAQASPSIGGPIGLADLRSALPTLAPPLVTDYRNDNVAFLPPPADGGLGAAAAFAELKQHPDDVQAAAARSLAAVARWRSGGVTAESILATADLPAAGNQPYPASTSFVALDRDGNAVACDLTMNNLFGTGRILPDLGFVAAASPAAVTPPLLAAGLAWNDNLKAFRAAVAASGQEAAPIGVAAGMLNALRTRRPMSGPVPDPGRANVVACSEYLPGSNGSCGWATDPRGAGLALGAN